MTDRPSNHGRAAFCKADIDDAKRRRPAVELQAYAAARGLEFRGRGMLAGFRGALPAHPEYMYNLMRGVLPGGRFGVVVHELLQTHCANDQSMDGSFYAVVVKAPGATWRSVLKPDKSWLPYVGWLFDKGEELDDRKGPFTVT